MTVRHVRNIGNYDKFGHYFAVFEPVSKKPVLEPFEVCSRLGIVTFGVGETIATGKVLQVETLSSFRESSRKAALWCMLVLKRLLGKDVARLIAKMVFATSTEKIWSELLKKR